MDNIYDTERVSSDDEQYIRPQKLTDFVGQDKIKEQLDVFIKASLMRNESLDHVLLYGPPGLGKTTLAQIIANELGKPIRYVSGPAVEKAGDLASVLTDLEPGEVLFIDEIHRIPRFVEEVLYSAMEDYYIDLMIGKDGSSHSIRVDLQPFTLVGATTRFGDLSSPLRDRFGVVERLDYYNVDELTRIIKRTASVYEVKISDEAAFHLAKRSRGTPRIANRLFRRVRDFAMVLSDGSIDEKLCKESLDKLHIDDNGLDYNDYRYLETLVKNFDGGPVGLETLSASIGEESTTIEDVIEPYLLQEGYIKRTNRGRVALERTYKLLNIGIEKGIFSNENR